MPRGRRYSESLNTRLGAVLTSVLLSGPILRAAEPIPLPPKSDRWNAVRTAHFQLFGNATPAKTREVGWELERLRAVLLALQRTLSANSPVPTFIYVFKTHEAMQPYLPLADGKPANAGAYFQQSQAGNFIALSAAWNVDPREVVYHEYIHYFMRANFPPLPVWYEEGLADYYSTFRSDSGEARTGMIREDHLALLRDTGLMPLDRLFAVDRDSPEYNESLRQGIFYAQSWALVHYLTRGAPERAPQLGRFLQLLKQDRPRDAAFREAFGTDMVTLLGELVAYIRNKRFFYNRVKLSELEIPTDVTTTPMPYEDMLYRLGDLLAHGDADRLSDAERFLEAVPPTAPAFPGALAALGFVRLRQDKWDDAAALFRRAINAGSDDFRVFFYDGRLRWEELARETRATRTLGPKEQELLASARASFRRAAELNPDFPEALAALGRTYLLEPDGAPVDGGIAALEAARARLPTREDVAADLAELYDRKGQKEKGDAVLRGLSGPEAAQARADRQGRSELERRIDAVNARLQEGKLDEALVLLDGIIAESGDEVRIEMEAQRDQLRKAAARNRAIAQYNDAIALYNARDLVAARRAFEKLAAESADPDIAAAAREKAAELSKKTPNKS